MAKKRIKKVARGKALPPSPDSEFTAEAMRARGNAQAVVSGQKFGGEVFNAMLGAEEEDAIDNG